MLSNNRQRPILQVVLGNNRREVLQCTACWDSPGPYERQPICPAQRMPGCRLSQTPSFWQRLERPSSASAFCCPLQELLLQQWLPADQAALLVQEAWLLSQAPPDTPSAWQALRQLPPALSWAGEAALPAATAARGLA